MISVEAWSQAMARLHKDQVEQLLKPIDQRRIKTLDGNSYITAYDVRIWLNRIFGFAGWSLVGDDPVLLYEQERILGNGKDGYKVAYRATVTLVIHTLQGDASYVGSSVGEANMPETKRGDAHDMAMKTAESGALKRAAANLGDQFGLSLYNKGSIAAHVRKAWNHNGFSMLTTSEPEPELNSDSETSEM